MKITFTRCLIFSNLDHLNAQRILHFYVENSCGHDPMCPFMSYSSWPMVCCLAKYPQIILNPESQGGGGGIRSLHSFFSIWSLNGLSLSYKQLLLE